MMMMNKKPNGFTVVESLVAVLIFSLSGLAFSSFVSISANMQNKNKTKLSVSQVKGHVLGLISNKGVWYKNLRDANVANHPTSSSHKLNPELACLREGTPCDENVEGYPLTLTDQSGNVVIDGIDTTKGFTNEGAPCTGFSDSTPNPQCPWRLSLKWVPICPASGACVHPQVTINLEVVASPSFLEANSLNTAQLSLMVEQPKIQPPFAKKLVLLTNSVHYGYGSELVIDPTSSVVTESPGRITFSLPTNTSYRGGTLSMTGNAIVYNPDYATPGPGSTEKIYGTDRFNYKIRDSYTGIETLGTIYVQVMTPYTWTGLATGDTSITNKKNFCGRVVDGACDGATFPVSFLNGARETNLVFNEVCMVCNVDISARTEVRSIEASPYFTGTITQNATMVVKPSFWPGTGWNKRVAFSMKSGTWNGEAGQFLVTATGEGSTADPTRAAFSLEGGIFKAPSEMLVRGDIYIPNANSFRHNNGTLYWLGTWSRGGAFTSDENLQLWNFVAGFPKTSYGQDTITLGGWSLNLSSDINNYAVNNGFTVLNDLTIANTHRESILRGATRPNINLKGNLIFSQFNAGGSVHHNPVNVVMNGEGNQEIIGQVLNETERRDADRVNCGPSIIVNKASGRLTAKDSITLHGNFIFQSAGPYQMTNVNVIARGKDMTIDLRDKEIDGLYYTAGYDGGWIYIANDLTVNNQFYWNTPFTYGIPGIFNVAGGAPKYINIKGNAHFDAYAYTNSWDYSNTTILRFNGPGNQELRGTQDNGWAISNSVHVDKPSGTLNLIGSFGFKQDFFVNAGNVNFDPNFLLYNQAEGANGIVSQIRLHDPINQKIPNLTLDRTLRALSPIYVGNMTLSLDMAWWGPHYVDFASGSPIYISRDLTVDSLGIPNSIGSWGGNQSLILNGTGAQTIRFLGTSVSGGGTESTINLQVQNTSSSHVTIAGRGTAANIAVAAGATVDVDPSSDLSLTGTVAGVLNKNGRSPSGSMTVVGTGVINN